MNKNLIISLGLLVSFQALAQKEITVLTNTREVGQNLLTGEPVKANEYTFPDRIHDWIVRRWNTFNVSCNSLLALIISFIPFLIFDIRFTIKWLITVFVIAVFLTINAIRSWIETKEMLEFHAHCDQTKFRSHQRCRRWRHHTVTTGTGHRLAGKSCPGDFTDPGG